MVKLTSLASRVSTVGCLVGRLKLVADAAPRYRVSRACCSRGGVLARKPSEPSGGGYAWIPRSDALLRELPQVQSALEVTMKRGFDGRRQGKKPTQ